MEVGSVNFDNAFILFVSSACIDVASGIVNVLDCVAVCRILFFIHQQIRRHFIGFRVCLERINTALVGKANKSFAVACIAPCGRSLVVRATDGQTDVRQVKHSVISFFML